MVICFPRTYHLFSSKKTDADDIVLSKEASRSILESEVVIQEKIDGNCIGFSFNPEGSPVIQSRRETIDTAVNPFFKKVREFYNLHQNDIFDICLGRYVLFGEWAYWRHSVKYDALPSFFMAHDLFDKEEQRFVSVSVLEDKVSGKGIAVNHPIFRGVVGCVDQLKGLIGESQFGSKQMEGLYIRRDYGRWNANRYKFVSHEFLKKVVVHWREKDLVANRSLADVECNWSY